MGAVNCLVTNILQNIFLLCLTEERNLQIWKNMVSK